jgi:hypothetical protein
MRMALASGFGRLLLSRENISKSHPRLEAICFGLAGFYARRFRM